MDEHTEEAKEVEEASRLPVGSIRPLGDTSGQLTVKFLSTDTNRHMGESRCQLQSLCSAAYVGFIDILLDEFEVDVLMTFIL